MFFALHFFFYSLTCEHFTSGVAVLHYVGPHYIYWETTYSIIMLRLDCGISSPATNDRRDKLKEARNVF